MQKGVQFNHHNRAVDRMASIAKKRCLRKKYEKQLLSSIQKTKSTQTTRSAFAEGIEQVKKTKFDIELIKMVDCFLDGHGNYFSYLVSFQEKCL